MNDLDGLRVIVAGAGAVGSVTALRLLRCGADVLLVDPALRGDNASGVAAGMLAPAFETLLDPISADHFPWLVVARDAWPDLVDSLGAPQARIDRSGALFLPTDAADLEREADRLRALDPACEILSPTQAAALAPDLRATGDTLFTRLDWRLDAQVMLAALQQALVREGGRLDREAVVGWSGGGATMASGARHGADLLVLATGPGRAPWAHAPELDTLTPIKGHILRFAEAGPTDGPVLRAPGVYVVPSQGGVLAGATMQTGQTDRVIEPVEVDRLAAAAIGLAPSLAGAAHIAAAGVRAATPDGLPLVGPSAGGRVMLAVGARRNGWLLAPVMADVVVARLRGLDAGAFGTAFDPARFASR
jgi:glycine oxidase